MPACLKGLWFSAGLQEESSHELTLPPPGHPVKPVPALCPCP